MYLEEQALLDGTILDYGCGRGFDAYYFNMDKYDPFFYPKATKKKYDVIVCVYVLCTLPDEAHDGILAHIQTLLKKNGIAYIAVRRDGTCLYNRKPLGFTYLDLPILEENSQFCIYELEPDE
jgi:SAM-dependent methyltransferase